MSIPISVRNSEMLGSVEFTLLYDPQVLEATGVQKGSFSSEYSVDFNVKAPGQLRLIAWTTGSSSISGDGMLLVAVFQVRGRAGQESGLSLADIKAWDNTSADATPLEMLVRVEPPAPFVVSGAASWLTWRLAAGGLALLALCAGILMARKRKASPGRTASQAPLGPSGPAPQPPPSQPSSAQHTAQPAPPPEEPEPQKRPAAEPAQAGSCFSCGKPLYRGAHFCSKCGTRQPPPPASHEEPPAQRPASPMAASVQPRFCHHCGSPIVVLASRYCRECGNPLL